MYCVQYWRGTSLFLDGRGQEFKVSYLKQRSPGSQSDCWFSPLRPGSCVNVLCEAVMSAGCCANVDEPARSDPRLSQGFLLKPIQPLYCSSPGLLAVLMIAPDIILLLQY